MNIEQLKSHAAQLMQRHGVDTRGWTFHVDYRTKGSRLGQCRMGSKQIGISAWFAELNEDPLVIDTINHEIAHALAWEEFKDATHGPVWKAMCRRTGADPDRIKLGVKIVDRKRYTAICPHCHHKYSTSRVPRNNRYCRCKPPGSTRPLVWQDDKCSMAANTASRVESRALLGHVSEIQGLIVDLGKCNDKHEAKRIRAKLRKLGHKGGLS